MSTVRDLIDYIKAVDRLTVAVGINGRTQLNKDFERFRSMPGGVTASEYLMKRVRPYLPKGTAAGIYDPAGRMVSMTALLENIRIPEQPRETARR
jgi:hypothetical protein